MSYDLNWDMKFTHDKVTYHVRWTNHLDNAFGETLEPVGPIEFQVRHDKIADKIMRENNMYGEKLRAALLEVIEETVPDRIII
jgi:hypothetical protein